MQASLSSSALTEYKPLAQDCSRVSPSDDPKSPVSDPTPVNSSAEAEEGEIVARYSRSYYVDCCSEGPAPSPTYLWQGKLQHGSFEICNVVVTELM
jgi:hypothetical protein